MRTSGVQRMIETIEREAEFTARQTGRSSLDPRVMLAMARVPRDHFVPAEMQGQAFDNNPLPIGEIPTGVRSQHSTNIETP